MAEHDDLKLKPDLKRVGVFAAAKRGPEEGYFSGLH